MSFILIVLWLAFLMAGCFSEMAQRYMLRLPRFAEKAAAFHFPRHTMNSRLLSRTFAYRFWCTEGGIIGSIVEKCVPGLSKEENIRESDRYWMILHWMQLRFGIDAAIAIDVEVLIYGCCSEFAGSPAFVEHGGEICLGRFLRIHDVAL